MLKLILIYFAISIPFTALLLLGSDFSLWEAVFIAFVTTFLSYLLPQWKENRKNE